jgi:hypothetical protein
MVLISPSHQITQGLFINDPVAKRRCLVRSRTADLCWQDRFGGFGRFLTRFLGGGGGHGGARRKGSEVNGKERESGGLVGSDCAEDGLVDHNTTDGGEKVTTNQGPFFVETISALAPLFDPGTITEDFLLEWSFGLIVIIDLTVKTHPDPIMEMEILFLKGGNDITEIRESS